jgi:hypothetical protein
VIFPLMTAFSYGFLDNAINTSSSQFLCSFGFNFSPGSGCATIATRILGTIGSFITDIFTANPAGAFGDLTAGPFIFPVLQSFIIYGSLVAMGFTFLPLFNLTVVDAFIVDFSRSIGERMDFLSLLTRLL